MFAIEVEFLMGRAIASRWGERDRAEWPPDPQRLFSALVATHFELDLGPEAERALRWLEALPPPELKVDCDPDFRLPLSHWVPVNDEAVKVEKNKVDFRHVLERRNRQERWFPAVVPQVPVVVYQWTQADGVEAHRAALARLVQELAYLGHSASPVRACVRDGAVPATLVPAQRGDYALRVPGPGRFDRLQAVHALRAVDESVQPPLGRIQAYAEATVEAHSVFSPDALVLAFEDGPKLSLDSTLPLMQHLRSAILSRVKDPIPEVLSGHDPSGRPSPNPHLALVPLAFVGHRHADGSLKGVALVLPRDAPESARRKLRMAMLTPWQLRLGPLGEISMRLVEDPGAELVSLRFASYARARRVWATVTPVCLDRYPKKNKLTAEQIVAESCMRVGLPRPAEVRLGPVSVVSGVPLARDFRGQGKQANGRMRTHALLRFDEPVRGPLLIGAGRFVGLGVFVPVRMSGAS